MNDKEFADQKRRIERIAMKWRDILWLGTWQIVPHYLRETPDDMRSEAGSDFCTYMDIECKWHYMSAVVRFNMPECARLSDEEIERHIVHEFVHCLVNEMRAWTPTRREHEERVVSHLALALITVEARGWNDGKADLRKKQKAEAAKGG